MNTQIGAALCVLWIIMSLILEYDAYSACGDLDLWTYVVVCMIINTITTQIRDFNIMWMVKIPWFIGGVVVVSGVSDCTERHSVVLFVSFVQTFMNCVFGTLSLLCWIWGVTF